MRNYDIPNFSKMKNSKEENTSKKSKKLIQQKRNKKNVLDDIYQKVWNKSHTEKGGWSDLKAKIK